MITLADEQRQSTGRLGGSRTEIYSVTEEPTMRVTSTDPISGNDVVDLDNAPYVIEGNGDDALKIYFESEENKASYLEIESKTPQQVLIDTYNTTTGTAREM